jgi:hypothetical protein
VAVAVAAVAMVVAAIWHTDCAGSGGGDGYCNRKEGEQPIEELHGQKNYNVPLVAIPSKRYTQRDINKSSSGSALGLESAPS